MPKESKPVVLRERRESSQQWPSRLWFNEGEREEMILILIGGGSSTTKTTTRTTRTKEDAHVSNLMLTGKWQANYVPKTHTIWENANVRVSGDFFCDTLTLFVLSILVLHTRQPSTDFAWTSTGDGIVEQRTVIHLRVWKTSKLRIPFWMKIQKFWRWIVLKWYPLMGSWVPTTKVITLFRHKSL